MKATKNPPQRIFLALALILCVASVAVYFLIDTKFFKSRQSSSPSASENQEQVHNGGAKATRYESRPTSNLKEIRKESHVSSGVAAPVPPYRNQTPTKNGEAAPPQPEASETKPLGPGITFSQAAATYKSVAMRASAATERLRAIMDVEDPEKRTQIRDRLDGASAKLPPVAFGQALQDPSLKPIFMERLREPDYFKATRKSFQNGSEGGYLDFAGAKSPEELADLIVKVAPDFEGAYNDRLRALGLTDEMGKLLVDSMGAGWIKVNMELYMRSRGYEYNPQTSSYLPAKGKARQRPDEGTFYSLLRGN